MNKIAIIGAGWYGCHISTSLLKLGFDVKVYESADDILTKASGNNQNRLHLGLHYARHYGTRLQSRDGYQRFMERYPTLSSKAEHGNIYSIPKYESILDFFTYKSIMMSTGIEFNEIVNPDWSSNLEGSINCNERVIEIEKSRTYFKSKLEDNLLLNTPVESLEEKSDSVLINGENFDFVIDCTWGHFKKNRDDVFYEPTVLLYYETKENFPAFTLVDGPLASIYPTETKGLYTLSSVPNTPMTQFDHPEKAREFINSNLPNEMLNSKITAMEEQIMKYVPQFKDTFTYVAPQYSIKTKVVGAFDDRSCSVINENRYISVMSGKIDTIFHAMERILYYIGSYEELK